jgi:hypothetical protein
MLYYKIAPKCDPKLFLTITSSITNSAVLMPDLPGNDTQLWTPLEIFSSSNDKDFVLLNKSKHNVLAARGERETLTQIPLSKVPYHLATWSYKPVQGGNVFGAIQLKEDQAMNLNAFGDSWEEGTPVGIHDWHHGAGNEIWQFLLAEQA